MKDGEYDIFTWRSNAPETGIPVGTLVNGFAVEDELPGRKSRLPRKPVSDPTGMPRNRAYPDVSRWI